MNGYVIMFLWGATMGGSSVALAYESNLWARTVLWGIVSGGFCFALGWRLYGYFHPGVSAWPFA